MSQRNVLLSTLVIVLLCLSTAASKAQTQCSLKLSDLPSAAELRGFRLGMTKDEVKARIPQVSFARDDEFGVSKTTINPDFDHKIEKSSFSGVRSVSLDFLDSKLTSLWLGYDSTFQWKTVEDFVRGISASLRLPDAWQSWRVRGQQLKCADFSMTVSIVAEGPSFRIVDRSAEDLIAERRAAKEEERASADETEETEAVIADKKTKTYFTSDCPPSHPIDAKDQVQFPSSTEAEKAGYKKTMSCS
jgi:hypothetical protein